MIGPEVVVDVLVFGLLAVGVWWSGIRSVASQGRDEAAQASDHEPESESESEYECGDCSGPVSQIDEYPHDGETVEIYRCAACEREGAIVRHPDGHTAGRGILAEQADQRIYSGRDCARILFAGLKWLSKGLYGLLTRLFGGLKRLSQRFVSDEHSHEKPCAKALRCDHKETRDGNIEECDDPSCEVLHVEVCCVECGAHLGWRDEPRDECDVMLPGDWFEGPGGTAWRVVDPYLPVESDGTFAPCVWLVTAHNDDRWIECERFNNWVEAGDFTPIDDSEPVDGPETVAADGGTPGGADELGTVVTRLQRYHNSALVQVYDDRSEHLAYWDTSTDTVDPTALDYLHDQGFRVVQTGTEHCEVTDQEQAWIEVRRQVPAEDSGAKRGETR
jgi:hypothetical protein